MSDAWQDYGLMRMYERFTSIMRSADNAVESWVAGQLGWVARPELSLSGLDLGCGVGSWTRWLNELACTSVLGVDSSPVMLSRASVATTSAYVRYSEQRIVDVTETADVVLCVYAAHHAGPPDVVLSHIGSLVRPGGIAIVVDVINTGGWERLDYHRVRAERLSSLVAERVGDVEAKEVRELLLHPTWLAMIAEDTPPSLAQFVEASRLALPYSVVTSLGPETVGLIWRPDGTAMWKHGISASA